MVFVIHNCDTKLVQQLMVICVGSVNLDIFVDTHSSEFGVDRRGNFTLSVGGTTLNVASAIKALGVDGVSIVTALKKDSLITSLMTSKIQTIGITQKDIHIINTNKESAFLAYRQNGELQLAVNATPIERITIEKLPTTESVKAVFIDFNNSTATIKNLTYQAYKKNIPIYTNLVSESKAIKLLSCPVNYFTAIVANRHEIKAVAKKGNFKTIRELSSKYPYPLWVITTDCDGASVWQAGKLISAVQPPDAEKTKSYSGAGDAFTAGFLCARSIYNLDLHNSLLFANQVTASVLSKPHANLVDSAVFDGITDLIYKDKLTGLYTRKVMDIIQLPRQYSVVVLDIDHFKKVNDTYGHDAGDDVLREFGRIIKSCTRKEDYPLRWGGEEFIVIVSTGDSHVSYSIAERIRQKTEKTPFLISNGKKKINVTCSAGIASAVNTNDRSFLDVLKEADMRLYEAKQRGRNIVITAEKVM